jgi:enoyl-CoA hydratase/carnithine racemase
MSAQVTAAWDDGVLTLTFRNPPANCLSLALMRGLADAVIAAERDGTVRVIVIAAEGKLFSAGHDLKEMSSHRIDADGGRAFFEETFALCSSLMQRIATMPKPVIASVDGLATAAGCQLVASCDLAVASDRSRFGVNGIDVGLFCTTPSVALTRDIGRKRAMELLLTGEMLDAATALDFGLVNGVVPAEHLVETVSALAEKIAAKAPEAIRLGKAAVAAQAGMSLAEAYASASRVMVENLMADDAIEGIGAFLDKRSPREAG